MGEEGQKMKTAKQEEKRAGGWAPYCTGYVGRGPGIEESPQSVHAARGGCNPDGRAPVHCPFIWADACSKELCGHRPVAPGCRRPKGTAAVTPTDGRVCVCCDDEEAGSLRGKRGEGRGLVRRSRVRSFKETARDPVHTQASALPCLQFPSPSTTTVSFLYPCPVFQLSPSVISSSAFLHPPVTLCPCTWLCPAAAALKSGVDPLQSAAFTSPPARIRSFRAERFPAAAAAPAAVCPRQLPPLGSAPAWMSSCGDTVQRV